MKTGPLNRATLIGILQLAQVVGQDCVEPSGGISVEREILLPPPSDSLNMLNHIAAQQMLEQAK